MDLEKLSIIHRFGKEKWLDEWIRIKALRMAKEMSDSMMYPGSQGPVQLAGGGPLTVEMIEEAANAAVKNCGRP